MISREIILRNCRPAINGQGVMPKNVFLGDSPKGKRIVYELPEGFLMLDLKTYDDFLSIGAEFSGFSQSPRWFFPISQAEVLGVDQFFRQGLGTGGQSGIYKIIRQDTDGNPSLLSNNWSYDSYLTFAFLGKEETLAIGNVDHNDFLQRSTLYNHPHRSGLTGQDPGDEQVFFEAGMLLEDTKIKNEYIKLPELHFYAGNRPFETLQELTWNSGDVTKARQSSVTSYHLFTTPGKPSSNTLEKLKQKVDYIKAAEPRLPVHTIMINQGYCEAGDWLEPNEHWPGGLDHAAREIFKDGYRAGIWLAPFAVSPESKLFRQHPEWLLKDYNEQPVTTMDNSNKVLFALDISHPGVKNYLSRVFRSLRKTGFIFYETAHMDLGLNDSKFVKRSEPGKSCVQQMREILQLIRDEIGHGSLWLTDHMPFAPGIGYADIVRTANKITGGWNSPEVENMIRETYFTHYFNNIYWQNHPGEIDLSGNPHLTEEEKRSLSLWQGILGGAVGTSDDIAGWTKKQLDFFRFLEPNRRQQNAFLPFWPDPEEIKVAVRFYKPQNGWGVLFFNDKDYPVEKSFELIDLIEEESAYVFSWRPEIPMSFGKLTEIDVNLGPHQSRLFYLSDQIEGPPESLTLGGKLTENE